MDKEQERKGSREKGQGARGLLLGTRERTLLSVVVISHSVSPASQNLRRVSCPNPKPALALIAPVRNTHAL